MKNVLIGILAASIIISGGVIAFVIYKNRTKSESSNLPASTNTKNLENVVNSAPEHPKKISDAYDADFERFLFEKLDKVKDLQGVDREVLFQLMTYIVDKSTYRNHLNSVFGQITENKNFSLNSLNSPDDGIMAKDTGNIMKFHKFSSNAKNSGFNTCQYWQCRSDFKNIEIKNYMMMSLYNIPQDGEYTLFNIMVPHLCNIYFNLIYKQARFLIAKSKVYPEILNDGNLVTHNHFLEHTFYTNLLVQGFNIIAQENEKVKRKFINKNNKTYMDYAEVVNNGLKRSFDTISKILDIHDFKLFLSRGPQHSLMKKNMVSDWFRSFRHKEFEKVYNRVLGRDTQLHGGNHAVYKKYEKQMLAQFEQMRKLYRDLYNEEKKLEMGQDPIKYINDLTIAKRIGSLNEKKLSRFVDECLLCFEYVKTMRKIYFLFVFDIFISLSVMKSIIEANMSA